MTFIAHQDAGTMPIRQAARLLGVHPNTLRAWADQGRIQCLRVNARGDRRFVVADLHSFLRAAGDEGRRPTRAGEAPAPKVTDWKAQVDSIAKLGTRLNRLRTVSEIGTAICVELRQLIDYHNVRVYRVDGEMVVPVAWRGEIGAYTGEIGEHLQVRLGEGITGWVAQHGVAQYLPDAARDPRGTTMPGTEEGLEESMLLAPMLYEDRAAGVIVLSKLGLEQFTLDDLRYLEIYASVAAQAMVNADISERLRDQERTLKRQLDGQRELLRVTESILTNLDPAAVVEEMADSLGGLIPVDDLAIHVHEPRLGRLRPLLARGAAADSWMKRPLSDASGVAAEALASGEARHVRRLGRRPAALIVAPLRGRERVLGVLSLRRNGREARFEAKEFDLVRLFGAHVSIALQNAFAHRAVELRAQTDALTGLKNHGTFQDSLAAAVERGAPFALLMVDLDDFKAYNDRHGHEAGNEMLRSIAVALQAACRESDEVYRYGGDEFTLILMQSGCGGALEVAERVRRAVRDARGVVGDMRSAVRDAGSPEPDAPSRGRDHAARMRCSVGVACFPDDAATRAELLVAADRALYAAKRAGRDRTASAASLR